MAAVGKVLFGVALLTMYVRGAEEVLFRDNFKGGLAKGWSWIREDPGAWRVTQSGLEIHIQPGNMWGPANDARNVLVRPALDAAKAGMEVSVTVSNRPSAQYEQVDLVWYYDDGNMVKLGEELVDGKLSIVMGREENDKTRTIAIIPLASYSVELRLAVKGNQIQGSFRPGGAENWRKAGECDLPTHGEPKVSLQCYQGPVEVEHWARLTRFVIKRAGPESK
jgi:regulation of enolase protein 1 (concanavalin A-like superfamily)